LFRFFLVRFNFVKNSDSLSALPAKTAIGQPFIELTEVESTNMYAMEQLQANMAGHGTAFFAHHQTAGKGQRGKTWIAEKDMHIALSVTVDTSFLLVTEQFRLSVAVALAVYDFFSKYAGDETSIKWPNDLYWRDRKAGGILIENIVKGKQWHSSVIGIGININQPSFPAALKNPVSLKQITGKSFDPVVLAKELCACLENRYRQLAAHGFQTMLTRYNELLFNRGEKTRLKKNSVVFNCVIEGVSAIGELAVSGGMSFRFGEVEWV
jgi:BirA family biotin operon repressor/biotin-[acetyl-CoA-carboxylase] ligase